MLHILIIIPVDRDLYIYATLVLDLLKNWENLYKATDWRTGLPQFNKLKMKGNVAQGAAKLVMTREAFATNNWGLKLLKQ